MASFAAAGSTEAGRVAGALLLSGCTSTEETPAEGETPAEMAGFLDAVHERLEMLPASTHPLVVLGMAGNPFVGKARKLLGDAGLAHEYIGIGSYVSEWRRRNALKMWTGWPTFPMVFVRGTLIGGVTLAILLTGAIYLPDALRRQLHEMGRTSVSERPAGTHARDILGRLLVDLSWASSKLEGNTYSRLDTQHLIEFGQVAQGKDAIETQMILNHKAAIEMLVEDADEVGFDAFTFKNLHAVLAQDLMRDPAACGRLRRRPVEISGTVFHPAAMPQVIEDCFIALLAKAAAIPDPFEQAFFLMVQLPYLQPFEDVNKRVSRIGANLPLIKHNLCPLSFIDVPERAYIEGTLGVYELNQIDLLRDVFVWAYERSCQRYLAITQTLVAPDPLKIKYREALIQAVQAVVKGLRQVDQPVLAALAREHADTVDQAAFTQMLATALDQLHEGSIARYRLRRSEYLAWQQTQARP